MTREERRFAVVAGGGTAGHVLPVLAVARAISQCGHDPSTIEIVGSLRGADGPLLEASGFPFTLLPGRGLLRSTAAGDLWANSRSAIDFARANARALRLLRTWQPSVVVTVGGYASFPAGLTAAVLGIPIVLVNTDAVPGLAHRMLAPFAAASAVAFPGTPMRRAVVTGTPVREEMARVVRTAGAQENARRALGVPEHRDLVVAFGGSLGARRVNEAVWGLARCWQDRKDVAVYHVVGRRDWDAGLRGPMDGNAQPGAGGEGLWYRAVPFEDRMPLLYEAADVALCRAGAMTVGELAVTGVPAILVPLPGAPDDHQTANALILVKAGAAELLPDGDCDPPRLEPLLGALLKDAARRAAMSNAARTLARADAAHRVAGVVIDRAR